VLYRLQTGVQWRCLPLQTLFGNQKISYKTVYYYFNKWAKDGSLQQVHQRLLSLQPSRLRLGICALDGTHTRCQRDCQASGWQGRKKAITTNLLLLTDNQGLPVALAEPIAGNHNDLYQADKALNAMVSYLNRTGLRTQGIFLNADAGFDSQNLQTTLGLQNMQPNIYPNPRAGLIEQSRIFDTKLYRHRFKIERTNAWFDAFRAIKFRYDKLLDTWKASLYLAACCIIMDKLNLWTS
jgi:transposase